MAKKKTLPPNQYSPDGKMVLVAEAKNIATNLAIGDIHLTQKPN